jgi:hypothetical protein
VTALSIKYHPVPHPVSYHYRLCFGFPSNTSYNEEVRIQHHTHCTTLQCPRILTDNGTKAHPPRQLRIPTENGIKPQTNRLPPSSLQAGQLPSPLNQTCNPSLLPYPFQFLNLPRMKAPPVRVPPHPPRTMETATEETTGLELAVKHRATVTRGQIE